MCLRIVFGILCCFGPFAAVSEPVQYSFTIWNWEEGYRDFAFFCRQVDACKAAGFTTIELGAGWPDCEPEPGVFDFTIVDERTAYIGEKGLDVRLRVNVSHWPGWFDLEKFENPDGSVFLPDRGYPSLFNDENRTRQLRFVQELAKHFAGRGYIYTPGFSVHMEVKFAAWNSYEPSARHGFRNWLSGRYGRIDELNRAWGTEFGHIGAIEPPVPESTEGDPDFSPMVRDWILYREQVLADWVRAFAHTVRAEDSSARISVPLGESYRRESAAFANLDYWGYSRAADEVVHSYDFFWHGPERKALVITAVAAMAGITQRPVVLEIDGPHAIEHYGYTVEDYREIGNLARDAGAYGIQVTNWGSVEVATQQWMAELGQDLQNRQDESGSAEEPQVLYYVSKWLNYAYREPGESLYDLQFGLFSELRAAGFSARIVTDENLLEEAFDAKTLVIPYAPLIDAPVRERIRTLSYGMRVIAGGPVGVYTATTRTQGHFGAKIEQLEAGFPTDPNALRAAVNGDGPSRVLRVAAAQFHTRFDVAYNTERIVQFLCDAAARGVDVVAFTEMALTGYTKREAFRQSVDWIAVDQGLARIQATCSDRGIYAVVGAPTRDGDAMFCSALTIGPAGELVDVYEKTYLAGGAMGGTGPEVLGISRQRGTMRDVHLSRRTLRPPGAVARAGGRSVVFLHFLRIGS